MNEGSISLASLSGGFDLQSTIESGQTYLWRREDGRCYQQVDAYGGSDWYYTVLPGSFTKSNEPEFLKVRQHDAQLEWQSTAENGYAYLKSLCRLEDDLSTIRTESPTDQLIRNAFDAFAGLRLVRDPPFGCLISFICSAQMQVPRIHRMISRLTETYGTPVTVQRHTYRAFPEPSVLADASESELRELSLGYRAPYVKETADQIASGDAHPVEAMNLAYEPAREYLQQFVGVGNKVADCVLLFSLDFLQAVPLDTWIQKALEQFYPSCVRENYRETSRAIRSQFGNRYAGYIQTYVFAYLRSRGTVTMDTGET